MTDATKSDREFITEPDEPFGWTVFSHASFDNYAKPQMVESWPTEEAAIHYGRIRHDQGYVVSVYKNVAYTVGGAE